MCIAPTGVSARCRWHIQRYLLVKIQILGWCWKVLARPLHAWAAVWKIDCRFFTIDFFFFFSSLLLQFSHQSFNFLKQPFNLVFLSILFLFFKLLFALFEIIYRIDFFFLISSFFNFFSSIKLSLQSFNCYFLLS